MVDLFEMVAIMLGTRKPKKPNDPKQSQYDPQGYFYDIAQKEFLNNPQDFLKRLQDYKSEFQDSNAVEKTRVLYAVLEKETVRKSTKDLLPIYSWIGSQIDYHDVLKIVNPKRAIAKEMSDKLNVVQKNLNEKRAILKEVNDKIQYLQNKFAEMVQKEKDLNQEIEDCKKKLVRAEKMISGLAGEETRWKETVKTLGKQRTLLIGDCLIAAGMVAYSGAFTTDYRLSLEKTWRK